MANGMISEYYRFDPDDARRFSREIGAATKEHDDELIFQKCPYCGKTSKSKEKFSINLKTGQFNCFRASCGVKGNMLTLAKDFNFSLGTDADEYYNPPVYKWRKFKKPEPVKPKDRVLEYMASRKIYPETVERYGLNLKNGTDNVLAFPFLDEHGELKFIKYRNMDFVKGVSEGSKEWCERDCEAILFGMYQCDTAIKTLIITEGQIDSLSVAACGIPNAVSVPTGARGFTWVPHCWDWMQNFDKIIVFGDYENGEITLLSEIKSRFSAAVQHVREEDYLDCKDANEILCKYGKEQIQKCIDNAITDLPHEIVRLSDVQPVDPLKTKKLPTGINKMDKLLRGGVPFGAVTIIAGKRGEGKSVLASQICASAIRNGNTVFAYSGELSNDRFQLWLDMQMAGPRNVSSSVNSYGDEEYYLNDDVRQRIHAWYQDRIFVYNSNFSEFEEQMKLLDVVERAIVQQNADVILLDNLMTAIDLDAAQDTDKYERQSKFVKAITRIAVRNDVVILLVAHNRKNSDNGDRNDDVSGSSDITNLASVTIGYRKATQAEIKQGIDAQQRFLMVTKNRLYGKVNMDGYEIKYDEASRRITCDGDDVNAAMGWENIDDEWSVCEQEELPFGL